MNRIAPLSALVAALAGTAAHAHPGHSPGARTLDELVHLLTSPDHLPALVLLALVVAGAGVAVLRRAARKESRRDPR